MKRYYQHNGHFRVSRKEDQSLADFCRNVRYARNYPGKGIKVKMTEDRIASLDAIGFQWKSTNQTGQINSCENSQSKSDDQHDSNSQNEKNTKQIQVVALNAATIQSKMITVRVC